MRPSFANVVEALLVGMGAAFYVVHWWPVPALGVIAALACLIVASLPLWATRFTETNLYGPLLQAFGFGLLFIVSLMRGRASAAFAVGFGILCASATIRALRELLRRSR